MNSISIVGRLTKDIELRRTQSGKAVATYSLAVKRPRAKDETDFINVVTWEKAAEYLAQYGGKGDVVAVSGSLQSRKWTDKNGNNRTEWEVVTDNVELLSGKRNTEASPNTTPAQNSYQGGNSYAQQGFGGYAPIENDDPRLPF